MANVYVNKCLITHPVDTVWGGISALLESCFWSPDENSNIHSPSSFDLLPINPTEKHLASSAANCSTVCSPASCWLGRFAVCCYAGSAQWIHLSFFTKNSSPVWVETGLMKAELAGCNTKTISRKMLKRLLELRGAEVADFILWVCKYENSHLIDSVLICKNIV